MHLLPADIDGVRVEEPCVDVKAHADATVDEVVLAEAGDTFGAAYVSLQVDMYDQLTTCRFTFLKWVSLICLACYYVIRMKWHACMH